MQFHATTLHAHSIKIFCPNCILWTFFAAVLNTSLPIIKNENQQSGNISSTTLKQEYPADSVQRKNIPNYHQQNSTQNFMFPSPNRHNRPPRPPQLFSNRNMSPQAGPWNALLPLKSQPPRMKSPRMHTPNQMPRVNYLQFIY